MMRAQFKADLSRGFSSSILSQISFSFDYSLFQRRKKGQQQFPMNSLGSISPKILQQMQTNHRLCLSSENKQFEPSNVQTQSHNFQKHQLSVLDIIKLIENPRNNFIIKLQNQMPSTEFFSQNSSLPCSSLYPSVIEFCSAIYSLQQGASYPLDLGLSVFEAAIIKSNKITNADSLGKYTYRNPQQSAHKMAKYTKNMANQSRGCSYGLFALSDETALALLAMLTEFSLFAFTLLFLGLEADFPLVEGGRLLAAEFDAFLGFGPLLLIVDVDELGSELFESSFFLCLLSSFPFFILCFAGNSCALLCPSYLSSPSLPYLASWGGADGLFALSAWVFLFLEVREIANADVSTRTTMRYFMYKYNTQ